MVLGLRLIGWMFVLSFFVTGCSSVDVNKSPAPIREDSLAQIVESDSTESNSDWRLEMLDDVNQVRSENGVSRVELCEALNEVAQDYAIEMQDTENFSHTGVDGSSIGDRATKGGYKWLAISENIAMGYTDVASVMDGWINSPGHFKNLVSDKVSHVGFGKADSPVQSDIYWVQNFGTGGSC